MYDKFSCSTKPNSRNMHHNKNSFEADGKQYRETNVQSKRAVSSAPNVSSSDAVRAKRNGTAMSHQSQFCRTEHFWIFTKEKSSIVLRKGKENMLVGRPFRCFSRRNCFTNREQKNPVTHSEIQHAAVMRATLVYENNRLLYMNWRKTQRNQWLL